MKSETFENIIRKAIVRHLGKGVVLVAVLALLMFHKSVPHFRMSAEKLNLELNAQPVPTASVGGQTNHALTP